MISLQKNYISPKESKQIQVRCNTQDRTCEFVMNLLSAGLFRMNMVVNLYHVQGLTLKRHNLELRPTKLVLIFTYPISELLMAWQYNEPRQWAKTTVTREKTPYGVTGLNWYQSLDTFCAKLLYSYVNFSFSLMQCTLVSCNGCSRQYH